MARAASRAIMIFGAMIGLPLAKAET